MSKILKEASIAIAKLRKKVRWKPGKAEKHLAKRKSMGHVPGDFSIEDYNRLIQELVSNEGNSVYLYKFGTDRYYGVGGSIRSDKWLVIFSKDGVMETAFPPDRFEGYLEKRGFEELGKVGEVI